MANRSIIVVKGNCRKFEYVSIDNFKTIFFCVFFVYFVKNRVNILACPK